MQHLPLGDVVSIGASRAFATALSEGGIHNWSSRKMRRFGSDQMPFNFNPQAPGPSYYRPPARAPYSHIQVVQKPDAARQGQSQSQSQHASQQVTFRKSSYSKEAESLAANPRPPAEDRRGE